MDTTITLLGPPGSGKGTQGARLEAKLGYAVLSTGDALREARTSGTDLGRRAAAYMDRGALVPDELIVAMVDRAIAAFDGTPVILDGVPRTVSQAQDLAGVLAGRGRALTAAILIDVPDDEVIRRIIGRHQGRADDTPATARERLRVYHRDTEPLVAHYAELGVLHRVDGAKDADSVEEEVRAVLG